MLLRQKLAFSVGHVLNDLTAAVWFTYLVAYFQKVLGMGADWAGYVMLFGQVADAISTTFVGIESDRTSRGGFRNYGRRKTWHLFGTLCVVLSFPFIFMPCFGCETGYTSDWAMFVYYAPFVALFQFGWAAIQISHLALIPELAKDSEQLRVTLAARRNDFTVASTIAVYLLTWLLFGSDSGVHSGPDLDEHAAPQFQMLSLILVATGIVFTVPFHIFVAETKPAGQGCSIVVCQCMPAKTQQVNKNSVEAPRNEHQRSQGHDRLSWFLNPLFYSIAILYTGVRIVLNASQTVLPLYILETLKLQKDDIATVPLAMYVAGFLASLVTPYLDRWLGKRRVVLFGSIFVIASCIWVFFLDPPYSIYGAVAILGASQQIIYIASITLTSDIIATNVEGTTTAAFVWGVLSFFDKIANGVTIMLIQKWHTPNDPSYYKWMLAFVPGGGAIIGVLAVAAMTYFLRKRRPHEQSQEPKGGVAAKESNNNGVIVNSASSDLPKNDHEEEVTAL